MRTLLFLFGAIIVTNEPIQSQPPGPGKIERVPYEDRPLKEPFNERVTVKVWTSGPGGKPHFLDPVSPVHAWRTFNDKIQMFGVHPRGSVSLVDKGSEITDEKGNVFVVTSSKKGSGFIFCHVKKKE